MGRTSRLPSLQTANMSTPNNEISHWFNTNLSVKLSVSTFCFLEGAFALTAIAYSPDHMALWKASSIKRTLVFSPSTTGLGKV